ncbi:hypothetical protein GIB67_036391 [Kingdonia uniflora]|uniref:Uncharacterized protein n=1 Tax=Kingdonia uniflora TaxID=39325 RepID=A0A7J7L470_9MAGN|nr:hypothetical protein GIB67_036391 [Kingdonia uniflora]
MEREERIYQLLQARREEREAKRKMLFYLRSEEARKMKLEEEERARKQDGNNDTDTGVGVGHGGRKDEEGSCWRKAQLDAIAEKQGLKELEIDEKLKSVKTYCSSYYPR